MNQYTHEQLIELFDLIRNNGIYPSMIVNSFMLDETNLVINDIHICADGEDIYKNIDASIRREKKSVGNKLWKKE